MVNKEIQDAFEFIKKSYPQGSKKWKSNVAVLEKALADLEITRKALLIACSKLGYEKDKCDKCELCGGDCNNEPETLEEAQAISIHNQYTRPKQLAKKMLDIANTDRYNLQTNITLKFWDKEFPNELKKG